MPTKTPFRHPSPGRTVRVIGAGLPRTGTNSFMAALSTLLEGPVYHAGVQWAQAGRDESHVLTLVELSNAYPFDNPATRPMYMAKLKGLVDGYVATADPPLTLMVPELMELYPDAVVICTTREKEAWVNSAMQMVQIVLDPRYLGWLFFWIPSIRHIPTLYPAMKNAWQCRMRRPLEDREQAEKIWEEWPQWLRENVPKERLVFYDVKSGWGPLCEVLGVEVPEGKAFPRLNDKEELEGFFKEKAREGMVRWVGLVGGLVAVVGVGWKLLW